MLVKAEKGVFLPKNNKNITSFFAMHGYSNTLL